MNGKTIDYLGIHTAIGYLGPEEWKEIPYLKENEGGLPPLVIAVGDARRVERAGEVLALQDKVALHEYGRRLLGRTGRGRVHMLIGTFRHRDEDLPIVVVETQMGMPATEIILREVLAHCRMRYTFGDNAIETDGLYIVRAGTAGGINEEGAQVDLIEAGDVVNAIFSIGWSGALIESMAGLDYFSPDVKDAFRDKWEAAGFTFTDDGRFPMLRHAPDVVEAIDGAAHELGVKVFRGGNFSKDSLYAEIEARAFVDLRDMYGVMSTEMEQMVLAGLTSSLADHGVALKTGLISGVLGVLNEDSFPTDAEHREKAERVEASVLEVAACALWRIVHG